MPNYPVSVNVKLANFVMAAFGLVGLATMFLISEKTLGVKPPTIYGWLFCSLLLCWPVLVVAGISRGRRAIAKARGFHATLMLAGTLVLYEVFHELYALKEPMTATIIAFTAAVPVLGVIEGRKKNRPPDRA